MNVSLMPSLINTIIMVLISLLIAAPIGILSAIYLVEYAKRGNRLVGIIRITAETLSGIRQLFTGCLGFILCNCPWLGNVSFGRCIHTVNYDSAAYYAYLRGSIKISTDSYREGSFGLGAGKLRTVFKIVLPSAMPVF